MEKRFRMICLFHYIYIYIYIYIYLCVCVCVCTWLVGWLVGFYGKYTSAHSVHNSKVVRIMNAMCTFMYRFVVYFSFASVISASIHRYVNYFDIQVLMMVTETETLTSTLHHNIFAYLYYVFSATFILSDFNPYLLS